MSAIAKIRETARNSEILPPKFAAFQLESKDSHFINGNIYKQVPDGRCLSDLKPILNPKVNPIKIHNPNINRST